MNAAEDPNITTGYTDYFPADGMQTTLTIHCVGAARIQKCKNAFLVNGRQLVVGLSLHFHVTTNEASTVHAGVANNEKHFPNTTFVADNNATATVYESWGRMEQTYPAPISNCSQL